MFFRVSLNFWFIAVFTPFMDDGGDPSDRPYDDKRGDSQPFGDANEQAGDFRQWPIRLTALRIPCPSQDVYWRFHNNT